MLAFFKINKGDQILWWFVTFIVRFCGINLFSLYYPISYHTHVRGNRYILFFYLGSPVATVIISQ